MSATDDARRSMARQWLAVANRDMRAARICLGASDPVPEIAAYPCQQATEKIVKSLLVLADAPFRKTHDIETLRDLAVPHFPDLMPAIDRLLPVTPWAHAYRYPGMEDDPVPSIEDPLDVLADIESLGIRIASHIGTMP